MFTFWRRLIGTAPAQSTQGVAVEDERRLWVRYATDLPGNVQLAEKGYRDKILAKVRDLSLGGANLVVERSMEPGQMLSLELRADEGAIRTVLACVVRANATDDGAWSLGCVFSRELSDEDLSTFGAQKVQAAADDKRIWVRYDCQLQAKYRKFGEDAADPQLVQVLNISASGIGLSVKLSLEIGSLLTVDLLDKAGQKTSSMLACVVHTAQTANGDYAIGCNFIRELTEEELQALL